MRWQALFHDNRSKVLALLLYKNNRKNINMKSH